MKKLFFVVTLFTILFKGVETSAQDIGKKSDLLLEKLEEYHPRDGLPNVFQKIRTNREIRIAYLGGSITAAKNGWRDMTFDWFRLNFPQTIFYQTDAAIGGTGSDLGVFRFEKDVLDDNPDLIFVEFAVNDGGKSREEVLRSMEGIIRQCWYKNPEIDLCFVYTSTAEHIKKMVLVKLHTSVLAMEELADYYGIPSIHMGIEVARLFAEGKVILTGNKEENMNAIVFTGDGVHPLSESGHPLYASTVVKYLDKLKQNEDKRPHQLKTPYSNENWENARMLDLSMMEKTGNWELLPAGHEFSNEFSKFIPHIYKGTPGCKLEFSFRGPYLALYDIIGPGTGVLQVRIDGKEIDVMRFDSYCTYYRLHRKIIANDLGEGVHHAEIIVTDKVIDKEDILRKRGQSAYDEHPEEFEETNWYAGYILVLE